MLGEQFGMNSKIGIISIINLKHSSLLSIYTDYLNEQGIEYDIIYYDRYGIEESSAAKDIYKYTNSSHNKMSSFGKIYHYYRFRKFVISLLKRKRYNQLIIWNSFTAFLISDIIIKKYKDKYFLNIRDYGFEKVKPIYLLMNVLIKRSIITTYSSPGFLDFLPHYENQEKLLFVNSFRDLKIKHKQEKKKNEVINIGFIGNVRFFDNDIKLLETFKNDSRFLISFYGTNTEYLRTYCEENQITNVDIEGPFPIEKTEYYLEKIDVMNNLYGFGSTALDKAVSIKYYHALTKAIPIIVYEDTFMEEFCVNKFVFKKNYNQTIKEDFYNWYIHLNSEQLITNAKMHLSKIENENKYALNKIHSYIQRI